MEIKEKEEKIEIKEKEEKMEIKEKVGKKRKFETSVIADRKPLPAIPEEPAVAEKKEDVKPNEFEAELDRFYESINAATFGL